MNGRVNCHFVRESNNYLALNEFFHIFECGAAAPRAEIDAGDRLSRHCIRPRAMVSNHLNPGVHDRAFGSPRQGHPS